jgi:PAS domain S-box-containing protein
MPADDMQKLLHELQVHQIELEMQNDQLRRTQLELEIARERLLLPYEAAPVGFLSLDAKGIIQEANLSAARLLEVDRFKLTGQKLIHFIAPPSQDDFYLRRRNLADTGENQTCELHLLRKSSPQFIARLELVRERIGPQPATRCLVMMSDITEQKQAEAKLRERADLLDAAHDAVIVREMNGTILFWNQGASEMYGFGSQQVLGRVSHEVLATVFPKPLAELQAGLLRDRRWEGELIHTNQSGARLVVDSRWRLQPGNDGRPPRVLEINNDITQRKQAEQVLREAHAQLEQRVRDRTKELTWANTALAGEKAFSDSLIQLAPAVIAVVDEQGNLIRTNAYAEHLAGLPFSKTQGRDMIRMLVPQNERPRVRRLLREALRGRAVQQVVAPLRARDGSVRQIEWFTKPLPNAEGKLSAVLAVGHDVTERKLAEDALRRSEHHLSEFFNLAPVGLIWLSASGTILRANQAQLEMLGYSAEEFVGHSFLDLVVEPMEGRELLARLARKEVVRNLQMIRRRRDGSIRHVLVDAISLWRDDEFQYSSIFLRDITERLNLESEVLRISEREQRRIAQDLHDGLGQLLVGTLHLVSNLQQDLAAKAIPEAGRLTRIKEVINEAIWQTRGLAKGLHPVEAEPHGLMAALESLAGRTQKLVRVPCQFICQRPVLVANNTVATHLFRIAQEAVTNAIKHGNPGRIEISLTATRGRTNLAVADDGTGMPVQRPEHAGMGLRIMHYRARMIGGLLSVQKGAAGGTTIACVVPREAKPARKGGTKARERKH